MLETLRAGPGFRIAMTLAVFAALCFTAPPAVMAFGHGGNTVHCLSHADARNHGMADHEQHGTSLPEHGDHAQLPIGKVPGCCGLFCISALLPTCETVPAVLELHEALTPESEARIASRIPELADRPPISSPSV